MFVLLARLYCCGVYNIMELEKLYRKATINIEK